MGYYWLTLHRCPTKQANVAVFLTSLRFCTGKPLSKWLVNHRMGRNENAEERRAVFVVRQNSLLFKSGTCCILLPG